MQCVAHWGRCIRRERCGHPLAVSAGLATLKAIRQPGFYEDLERKSGMLEAGLMQAAKSAGAPVRINRVGSMMTLFLTDGPVCNYADAQKSDADTYARFFSAMLEAGVYLAPSRFEAAFVSSAHTDEDIAHTIETVGKAFRQIV